MENEKKYYAFISYKREDEEWAKWLQHKLEHYKLPSNLNGRTDLPKEIRPIFKDTSELNPGNLPQQIHDALEQSKHLIVICSPRSAKSEWVNKEVETFIGMGKTDCIIPFIIDGKAFAKDSAEECYPEAIRKLPAEQEILGANISEMGRDAAAVKVVAQMFGLKFDELWQRYEREQRKRRFVSIAGVSALVLIALIVTGWIWKQRTAIRMENWIRMENEAKYVAEIANDLTDKGRSYEAQRVLIEVLPKDLEHPDRPWVPAAEKALRHAFSHDIIFIDGEYYDANYSPDEKTIASVSYDSIGMEAVEGRNIPVMGTTIHILDAENGKTIRVLDGINGVQTAAFSPDGSRIVSCIYNNSYSDNDWIEHQSIIIIEVDSGKELLQLTGHDKEITYASYSSDGKCIVSSSHDGTIRVWDAENGKELLRLNRNDEAFFCSKEAAKFSPDGKQILGVSDHFIKVWDAENGHEKFSVKMNQFCHHACYSPDGTIVIAAMGESIKAYDAKNGKEVLDKSLDRTTNYIDVTSDGKVALAFFENEICILDTESGKSRRMVVSTDDYGLQFGSSIARFAPNGQHFITIPGDGIESADYQGPIKIWKTNPVDDLHDMENQKKTEIDVVDSKQIELDADYIKILDAKTQKEIWKLKRDPETYYASFSLRPDGKHLAYVSEEGIIKIWNVEKKELIHSFHKDIGYQSIEYSPDGKCLLYYYYELQFDGSLPTKLYILDAETGLVLREFPGHADRVESASYSPDGKQIISSSWDGTIKIWDVESREEIATIYKSELWGKGDVEVSFCSEGKHVKVLFGDGKAETWYWPSLQELIDLVRERFGDNPLTPEERLQYHLK